MQARVDNNALVVLLNGSVVMGSFISSNVTTSSCDNNTVDINKTSDTSLEVTFKSGIAVDINEKLGMLSLVVKLPDQFMDQSHGLLGNMDGNATNEFVKRDGMMIPDSSSDSEIHSFAQSCKLWYVYIALFF